MKNTSVLRFGGFAAVAVGVLYLLIAATHFMLPRAQLHGAAGIGGEFFASLAGGAAVFQAHYAIMVLLALLTFAVIAAFLELLREWRTGPVRWSAALGFLGSALAALDFAQMGVLAPRLAGQFAAANPAARAALALNGVPHADPAFFAFGLLGGFALIVNAVALRRRLLPRWLALVGLAGGAMYLLLFGASLAQVPLLVDVSVGLGGTLLAPVWYIGSGLFIVKRAGGAATPGA